ncbi:hypothetical protein [Kitasatospora sp. NPDC057223]|uniref:hypothetical protein n=1 Tax=Kitasatospora sp. NPDC057223 TaxID=3346055 RepID=UPI003645D729
MNRLVRRLVLPIVIGAAALVGGYVSTESPNVQPDQASVATPDLTATQYTAADLHWG